MSHTIHGVEICTGDEIGVHADGAAGRLDYVQLNWLDSDAANPAGVKSKP